MARTVFGAASSLAADTILVGANPHRESIRLSVDTAEIIGADIADIDITGNVASARASGIDRLGNQTFGNDRTLARFLELVGVLDVARGAWLCPVGRDGRIADPIAHAGHVPWVEVLRAIEIANRADPESMGHAMRLPGDEAHLLCPLGDGTAGHALLFLRERDDHPAARDLLNDAAPRIGQLAHAMWISRDEPAEPPRAAPASIDDVSASTSGDALAGILADQCPFGILILDVDQYIHLANQCARQLLDARDGGMGTIENRLVIENSEDAIRVQVTLRGVLLGRGDPRTRRSVAITGADGAPLLLSISRMASPDGARACVILTRPGAPAEPDIGPLAELFGLTPVEARLVGQLVRGRSLQEAAHALHLKIQTVRTYLKQVFQKTGTHRQVELVQLMQNGALPVLA